MKEKQSKTKLTPKEKALELVNAYFKGKTIEMKDPERGVPDWIDINNPHFWSYLGQFCKNVDKYRIK